MANKEWSGWKEALKVTKDLPKNLQKRTIKAAARDSLRPVQQLAKTMVASEAQGSMNGVSKALLLVRAIKVMSGRGRSLSAKVKLDPKQAIPLGGGKRYSAPGYAKLFAYGNYKTPGRKGRGEAFAHGNFILEAASRNRSSTKSSFGKNLLKQMKKSVERTIAKNGKRN